MKKRILLDGTSVDELDTPIILTVKTKCPEKWILIDKETGEKYIGYMTLGKNSWKKISNNSAEKYNA
jgi:hypothetical protein